MVAASVDPSPFAAFEPSSVFVTHMAEAQQGADAPMLEQNNALLAFLNAPDGRQMLQQAVQAELATQQLAGASLHPHEPHAALRASLTPWNGKTPWVEAQRQIRVQLIAAKVPEAEWGTWAMTALPPSALAHLDALEQADPSAVQLKTMTWSELDRLMHASRIGDK